MTDRYKIVASVCLYLGLALIFLSDFLGFLYHDTIPVNIIVYVLVGGLVGVFGGIILLAIRRVQPWRRRHEVR
jgi:hypothetical protein